MAQWARLRWLYRGTGEVLGWIEYPRGGDPSSERTAISHHDYIRNLWRSPFRWCWKVRSFPYLDIARLTPLLQLWLKKQTGPPELSYWTIISLDLMIFENQSLESIQDVCHSNELEQISFSVPPLTHPSPPLAEGGQISEPRTNQRVFEQQTFNSLGKSHKIAILVLIVTCNFVQVRDHMTTPWTWLINSDDIKCYRSIRRTWDQQGTWC